MFRRGALLAGGLGALAIGLAGCGGSGSAVGQNGNGGGSTTATAGGTTTAQGGVLGAQANIDRQQLKSEASRIRQMLLGQLGQLRTVRSTQDLAAAAKSLRVQVLKSADRLDRLQLQSPQAQQQRGHLESALRSLAADLTTLQGDARSGNLTKALTDLGTLSSVIAVQQSIRSIQQRNASTSGMQALRGQATSISDTLQKRLRTLAGTNDPQTFARRSAQLERFLNRHDQQVQNLNVPKALQDDKQAVLRFLHNWEATVDAAHGEAAHGNLPGAKKQLKRGSLTEIQNLLTDLLAAS